MNDYFFSVGVRRPVPSTTKHHLPKECFRLHRGETQSGTTLQMFFEVQSNNFLWTANIPAGGPKKIFPDTFLQSSMSGQLINFNVRDDTNSIVPSGPFTILNGCLYHSFSPYLIFTCSISRSELLGQLSNAYSLLVEERITHLQPKYTPYSTSTAK